MYHRIDETETDPWNICVSPENFEQQIKFLKGNFKVISVDEVINHVASKNIKENCICITFDDGYADNYTNAKPVLEKYNCPATFFIAAAFINTDTMFWWDELEFLLLHPKKLPACLHIKIDGKTFYYYTDENELTDAQWLQLKQWKYYEKPVGKRCEIFLDIWQKLRPLNYNEINKQILQLKKQLVNNVNIVKQRLPMKSYELIQLSNNKLFTIGLHTHTHANLATKNRQVQQEEILMCQQMLLNKFNIHSNLLAYPYGCFNNDTLETVKELNIRGCFTTENKAIRNGSDLKQLGRIQVCNWNMNELNNQIENCFTQTNNNR